MKENVFAINNKVLRFKAKNEISQISGFITLPLKIGDRVAICKFEEMKIFPDCMVINFHLSLSKDVFECVFVAKDKDGLLHNFSNTQIGTDVFKISSGKKQLF